MRSIRLIRYFISLGCLLFFHTSIANPAATPDLNTLLHSIQSMRADFTQTIYDNRGKAIQTSYGKIALERPGKFRWEVTKPIPQLIVGANNKLWIYDQDLEQVTVRSLQQAAGDAPALLLSQESVSLDKNYNIKEIEKNNSEGLRWFLFTPKNKNQAMLASTEIGFVNQVISEMELKDNLGHITSIKFRQVETNASLPHSYFEFKTPKGVDVIDETNRQRK